MHISVDDPLARAIAPPRNETPEAKQTRESAELEARQVSDRIDEQIRQERTALKKKKKPVKVLLLGQSESGASLHVSNYFEDILITVVQENLLLSKVRFRYTHEPVKN